MVEPDADGSRISGGKYAHITNEKPETATFRVRKEEFEARSQNGHLVCIQLVG